MANPASLGAVGLHDRPRSSYSREQQELVAEQCRVFVCGILQEHATPENEVAATEWCVRRLREHRFTDTNSSQVAEGFRGLLEKLRVHSQLEAAEYLEEQHAAFMRCRLTSRHTPDAHAAALRAMLLLARQPTQVPLRMVRSLRAIWEGRRGRAEQHRRGASERELDRRALLELELRQVSESMARDWEEAWAEPDTVPEVGPAVPAGGAPTTEPSLAPSSPRPSTAASEPCEECPARRPLPRGALPRPAWHRHGSSRLSCGEVAAVQAALQALAGHGGELVEADGGARWRPGLEVEGFSRPALEAALGCVGGLASSLCRLRAVVAATLPLENEGMAARLAALLGAGRLCSAELARTPEVPRPEGDARQPPVVFASCWQSVGLALEELLDGLDADRRRLEADVAGPAAPTLLRLAAWAAPRARAAEAAAEALDAALSAAGRRCGAAPPGAWAAVCAEELVAQLAAAFSSEELAGGPAVAWLGKLWCGAWRPALRAMRLWGTVGELHDPCREFCADGAIASALVPPAVATAGCHVRSLQRWAEVDGRAAPRDPPELEERRLRACFPRLFGGRAGFVPFEAAVEAHALAPVRRLALSAARPLLTTVLCDESRGLLGHLSALRAVAFLEREDAVAPVARRLFLEMRRGASGLRPRPRGSLAIELNAALSEALDLPAAGQGQGSMTSMRLCARHLALVVDSLDADDEADGEPFRLLSDVHLRYEAPPPLDMALDSQALQTYTSVMALLLRLRFAQEMLSEVHQMPIFGFCHRRRPRGGARRLPLPMAHLALHADLLRGELAHFLSCLEWYFRVDVVQEGARSLDRRLGQLGADALGEGESRGEDALEAARRLHGEHLQRLLRECFLVPELRTVLADLEHLVGFAADLRQSLAAFVLRLGLDDPGHADPGTPRMGLRRSSGGSPHSCGSPSSMAAGCGAAELEEAVSEATAAVSRIQQEFRGGAKYLLHVLMFSVARGSSQLVARLCAKLNFSGFYLQDA